MDVAVFDIDDTIANCAPRRHFLEKSPKDWDGWYEEIPNDEPHWDMVALVRQLSKIYPIIFATARREEARTDTETWLVVKARLGGYEKLYMRCNKDFRPSAETKVDLLDQILAEGYNPVYWFDDNTSVVDALRNRGIRVLQVTNDKTV